MTKDRGVLTACAIAPPPAKMSLRAWCESHLERHGSPSSGDRAYLLLDENGAHCCALGLPSGVRCGCALDTTGRRGLLALERHLKEVHGRTFAAHCALRVNTANAVQGLATTTPKPQTSAPAARPAVVSFAWSRSLFVLASELALMPAWSHRDDRTTVHASKVLAHLCGIIDCSVDVLARELLNAASSASPTTTVATAGANHSKAAAERQLYADVRECAVAICRVLLAPSSPGACALPCMPSGSAEWEAIVQGIPRVIDDVAEHGRPRKRPRSSGGKQTSSSTQPPSDGAVVDPALLERLGAVRTAVFCRNAFRGPHTASVDVGRCERGDAGTLRGATAASMASWYRALAGHALEDDEVEQCPDLPRPGFVHSLRDAQASQFLCNGIVAYVRCGRVHRRCVERSCMALRISPIAVQLASILELADFMACALLPPPGVMAAMMSRSGLASSWGAADAQLRHGNEQTEQVLHGAHRPARRLPATSLTAIGEQSKALEATEQRLCETVAYHHHNVVSRKELLLQLAAKCHIPFADIVAAMAEMNHEDLSSSMPSTLGAPAPPTRDAFVAMTAAATEEYTRSMLRCQFRTVQGHHNDRALTLVRAQHVARVPLDALYVMVRANATKDPYEQLLLRYWRIPFSSQTTVCELWEWVWPSEIHVMAMNLLSYLDDDAAKMEAMRTSGMSRKLIAATLEALGAFLGNGIVSDGGSGGGGAGIPHRCLVQLVALLLRRRRVEA